MNARSLVLSAAIFGGGTLILYALRLAYMNKMFDGQVATSGSRINTAVMPGHDVMSQLAGDFLGVPPEVFLSFGIGWYFAKTLLYGPAQKFWALCKETLSSTVVIDYYDDLFACVLDWFTEQQEAQTSRKLQAKAKLAMSWDDWSEAALADANNDFSVRDQQRPPIYQPDYGSYCHWDGNRPIWISRRRLVLPKSPAKEKIVLTCIGWSTRPIKDLIRCCQRRDDDRRKGVTEIRFPTSKTQRDNRYPWDRPIRKRSRPIDSVVLSKDRKSDVVNDIVKFLHPSTRSWYHDRGIPYRRGYLYYGPPGTGKTSLTFALAGKVGLAIHCISLSDPTMTDDELARLFRALPDPCLVMLEDIDATHLRRTTYISSQGKNRCGIGEDDFETSGDPGLSLAGLLNAIDGVASAEGVILVMTTNYPERLDDALTRDGRVDLQIEFPLPGKKEMEDLFLNMYTHQSRSLQPTGASWGTSSESSRENMTETMTGSRKSNDTAAAGLKIMAEDFASRLPENKFSAAKVQGFLLVRRHDPRDALENVSRWAENGLTAKSGQHTDAAVNGGN
ncbi:MAG: hypothetical protein OHK93_006224 [Ramalina farinacea]|uniref:Mitochondrial chaperone BCS1 n=1 Tax=Ramalina farinacea TaxID=258253 RepID=A0AA43TWK1_9LECA|nr:hypothetical protein [Ramalina farinacea]